MTHFGTFVFRVLIIILWNIERVFVLVLYDSYLQQGPGRHIKRKFTPHSHKYQTGCKICFDKLLTAESRVLGKPSRTWMCVMIELARAEAPKEWRCMMVHGLAQRRKSFPAEPGSESWTQAFKLVMKIRKFLQVIRSCYILEDLFCLLKYLFTRVS